MEKPFNLQKTSKIYGVVKQGANRNDANLILAYQKMGYDEHYIQQEIGVHYRVIRSLMAKNAQDDEKNGNKNVPVFETKEPQPTADTQHLYDRIAELEKANAAKEPAAEVESEKSEAPEIYPEPEVAVKLATKRKTKRKKKAKAA